MTKKSNLKVTLIRSPIGIVPKHKCCIKGLGLKRMHHSVIVPDNACTRGLIQKVNYLLSVEDVK